MTIGDEINNKHCVTLNPARLNTPFKLICQLINAIALHDIVIMITIIIHLIINIYFIT